MAWVRSEYAGELAVLSVWLTALLPWSASHLRATLEGLDGTFTVINIRFVFFQLHYVFGFSFQGQSIADLVQLVFQVPAFVPANQTAESWVWVGGAALFLALLTLSFVYYAREDWLVDRSPVNPVRAVGAAFAVLGLVFGVATVMFAEHQTTVPIGTLFMWVFAALLLRVERT
jgi:hypothetical protein